MEQTESDRATFSAERIKKSTPWFLAVVILIALFIWFGLSFSAEKRQRGHAFIDALRAKRFDDAFAMCTPDLQETLVDAEGLQQKTNIEALPESFWWTEVDSLGNEATLKSRVRIWGSTTSVTVALRFVENEWRIRWMSAGDADEHMRLKVAKSHK